MVPEPPVPQSVKMWHADSRWMPASEMLRARVDKEMAKAVRAWAKAHGTDVSGALRLALRRLLEEQDRERRVAAAMRKFDDLRRAGVFDPPAEQGRAGGFR